MPIRTFYATYESLDEIREFVGGVASQSGFNEKEIYSLQLASDEAASNIIKHAYECDARGIIQVSCEMEEDKIVIAMRDEGKPFNPARAKRANLKLPLSERQVGGLGIYLIHKLMDDVHYVSSSREGNLLVMIKRRE
jgi:serine/threonine-protein kinase RsbW